MVTQSTSAVIVQMTTVSRNGSSIETTPSEAARRVLTAACAIGAEPMPASLEKVARRMPQMNAESKPPVIAARGSKASVMMRPKAGMISDELTTSTMKQLKT